MSISCVMTGSCLRTLLFCRLRARTLSLAHLSTPPKCLVNWPLLACLHIHPQDLACRSMSASVNLLAVALARAIHLRPEVVTNALILILVAASLALTWRALRFSSLRERAGGAPAVWATALLTILPMYDFGQREHLALVALLPALAVYILRANRERVAPSAILIAGLCAATTMNFKPYFVFGVGFCILTAAVQARDWRVLFAPENWIAAALVVIHAICIVVFYPEYFTLIYPLVRDVYLLLKVPFLAILLMTATALWLVAILVVLGLQSRRRKPDAASLG